MITAPESASTGTIPVRSSAGARGPARARGPAPDHRTRGAARRIVEGGGQGAQASPLEHGVAVQEEEAIAPLGAKPLDARVHSAREAAVLRHPVRGNRAPRS